MPSLKPNSAILASLLSLSWLQLANPAASSEAPDRTTVENELSRSRAEVLKDRPYRLDPHAIKQVTIVRVKPSAQHAEIPPEWWSDRQAYDLAELLALALSRYAGVKPEASQNWEEHLLSQEDSIQASLAPGAKRNQLNPLGNPIIEAQMDVLAYNFQHMPVKRRGLGLGVVALTVKHCSTETYLKTSVSIDQPMATSLHTSTAAEAMANTIATKLPITQLIKNSTGGASLNLNFLVGGAGGGNFTPPDKPLKKILFDGTVDSAEAIYCLITNQKDCLDYYQQRPHPSPTKLSDRDKRKVASC